MGMIIVLLENLGKMVTEFGFSPPWAHLRLQVPGLLAASQRLRLSRGTRVESDQDGNDSSCKAY